MINYETFLDEYYPTADKTQQSVKQFLDDLTELIGDVPLEQALQNEQILCRAFFLRQDDSYSFHSSYLKTKEYLSNLLKFFGIQGKIPTRETVMKSRKHAKYFRSINDLLEFVDSVGKSRSEYYNPTTDLIIVKSICILGWLGFSLEEIANMKKTDLVPVGLDKYCVKHGDEAFYLSGAPFAALYYLHDLESYRDIYSNKRVQLLGDKCYLFRASTNGEIITAADIARMLYQFNRQIPIALTQRTIHFSSIHKNAIFVEVYNDKSCQNVLLKLMSILRCDKLTACHYREQYLEFIDELESYKN